ncbi:MAG: hypothetical protein LBU60_00320 [Clostridiales bacterium]|nr:hypothetical protein [Clostridiales bacterium]
MIDKIYATQNVHVCCMKKKFLLIVNGILIRKNKRLQSVLELVVIFCFNCQTVAGQVTPRQRGVITMCCNP